MKMDSSLGMGISDTHRLGLARSPIGRGWPTRVGRVQLALEREPAMHPIDD
jgi:hypothetical protein